MVSLSAVLYDQNLHISQTHNDIKQDRTVSLTLPIPNMPILYTNHVPNANVVGFYIEKSVQEKYCILRLITRSSLTDIQNEAIHYVLLGKKLGIMIKCRSLSETSVRADNQQ